MNKTARSSGKVSVLFVCLGNICRSPTAQGVFEVRALQRGVDVDVDSCGTGAWHVGAPPDARATAEAAQRGYDLSHLRARQFTVSDFDAFDYILAMDDQNLGELMQQRPDNYTGYLGLLLAFAPGVARREVPDPYYGGPSGFSEVLDLVETASEGLLDAIAEGGR